MFKALSIKSRRTMGSFEGHGRKIVRLERLSRFEPLTSYPLELWPLEYRLRAGDIGQVPFAGQEAVLCGFLQLL